MQCRILRLRKLYITCTHYIFVVFVLLMVDKYTIKSNNVIIAKVIHEIMDDVVNKDANFINLNIVKSLVNHDSKGTYGDNRYKLSPCTIG